MMPFPWSRNAADEPFFREWEDRAPGTGRDLARAQHFAEALGLPVAELHPLVVVGSKGKGTTAAYAAATLHQAGRRVGLITSPGYRTNRERIRVAGTAISSEDYVRLSSRVAAAVTALPAREPGSGYLSPNGAFTIAGLAWLIEHGCDALVVEAGKGGASDESSLTHPSVVAVTSIFEEHVGVLGNTICEIAAEKAGIISASTRAVVSAPQQPPVHPIVEAAADAAGAASTFVPGEGLPEIDGLRSLPTPLMRTNAEVGVRAALAYDAVRRGSEPPADEPVRLPEVSLPGRLSVHRHDDQTWVLDGAINADGAVAALDWCRSAVGEPSTVLLSIPDSQDVDECRDLLSHPAVRLVRVDTPYVGFASPDGEPLPTLANLDPTSLGPLVLAIGTVSFVRELLDHLDVDTTRFF